MSLTIITIFLALCLMCAATYFMYAGLNAYVAQHARISRRMRDGRRAVSNDPEDLTAERLVPEEGIRDSVERFLIPDDPKRLSNIQKRLQKAGYRSPSAVRSYYLWKWSIAAIGLIASAVIFAALMTRANVLFPIAGTGLFVIISIFATDMWIIRQTAYRKMDLERAFPDALDLMLVCIEAGHGLDQALNRVSKEMSKSAPVLAQELALVVSELRAGKERNNVLSDFAERVGVEDVSAFVTVLKQAQQFGVSIADTLRVYSKEMRNKRFMRAEEKANMMPIKLALGAIAFTIPPVILILIGPSVILILREMSKATLGG